MLEDLTSESLTILRFERKPGYEVLSRAINIFAAVIVLAVFSPLIVLLAVTIKLSEPNAPVLYRGVRVGKGKRLFNIFKFRTMAVGAEAAVGGIRQGGARTRIATQSDDIARPPPLFHLR